MGARRVLAIEPEEAIYRLIRLLLSAEDYEVVPQAAPPARSDAELILIDIAPPYDESLNMLGGLREQTGRPTIALSSTMDDSVRHAILQSGADDFVVLPFEPDDLISRVRFLLGEQEEVESGRVPLVAGGLEVDFDRRVVSVGGETVGLSYSEWVLLETLALQPGQPSLTAELLARAWGPSLRHDHQFLRQWIARLQAKLGCHPRNPRLVRPYHDVGYALRI